MKILLIDDTDWKLADMQSVALETFPHAVIETCDSYHSAIPTIKDWKPDIILLDMSIPTYSRSGGSADRFRPFGGRDILWEIKRRKLISRVIVVTQFEYFPDGDESVKRSDLMKQLKEDFSDIFVGSVFYGSVSDSWRQDLVKLLKRNPK